MTNEQVHRARTWRPATSLRAGAIAIALLASACGGAAAPTQTAAPAETVAPAPTTAAPETTAAPATDKAAPADDAAAEAATESTEAPAPVAGSIEDVEQSVVDIRVTGNYVPVGDGAASSADWGGSGFIINDEGHAVTNYHVVNGAATINVTGSGVTGTVNAKVLGVSECSDVALIDLDGGGYTPLQWRTDDVTPGLQVFSAGFPASSDGSYTVTGGVVSTIDEAFESGWASVNGVLQHDARIRGGNSGGPLVDEEARIVGINFAGNDTNDANYAIAPRSAQQLIDALAAGSETSYGITPQAAFVNGQEGVWALSVASGSPADKAGIKAGDMILTMEGLRVGAGGTLDGYCDVIRSRNVTDVLSIEVFRPSTSEVLTGQLNGTELAAQTDYAGYTTIQSPNGNTEVRVPTEWSDIGGTNYDISASSDLDGLNTTWTVPGVIITDTTETSPDVALDEVANTWSGCDRGQKRTYVSFSPNAWDIVWEELTNCPDGARAMIAVLSDTVVYPGDLITVVVQVRSVRDEAAFTTILDTLAWS